MAEYETLTIAELRRETASAVSLGLRVPAALADHFRFKPGQHIPVRGMIAGEEVRRTYSICSGPGDGLLRIAIKRVDGGVFSAWANDTLRPGMTLDAMPPQGRFVLPPSGGAPRHVLALAAGIGITPIMSMLRHALELEAATRFTLVYGNRTMADVAFREALEDLKDRHLGRLSIVHLLSREESEAPLLSGRLTPDRMEEIAGPLVRLADIERIFICGPGQMIRDLRAKIVAMGFEAQRIHHEFFAPASGATRPAPVVAPMPQAVRESSGTCQIVAVLDGVRHQFEARAGEPVLEAALRAGLRVPYSCKGGMCCTCRARVVEGETKMRVNYSLEPWELEKGFTLTCQSVPQSGRLVIDYDQM